MTQPYPSAVTRKQAASRRRRLWPVPDYEPTDDELAEAVLRLVRAVVHHSDPPPVEQDADLDRELRWQLHRFYADTWAMARAQQNPRGPR